MTAVNVSFLITFLNASYVRERVNLYNAEAATVHTKPVEGYSGCVCRVGVALKHKETEEMVSRTRALKM
ncbi:unnamed protein product [Prunus armeniaca]|uniref:Uncharacterized protein n=1 Tax=Prunus armeniaca TaxID=36596 RepID=A0A6J5UQI9_PRUAR|nr:unnamed protein product [Prunus armeniaca]